MTVLLLIVAQALGGQTLADAARSAEEQRRERGAADRVVTNDSLPGEWEITTAGLTAYAGARAAVARIRNAHADVDNRLFETSRTAARRIDLEPALGAEPPIVEALAALGMTPRDYLRREQAFLVAVAIASHALPPDLESQPQRWANVMFVRNNPQLVRRLIRAYSEVERGAPWFAMWRFVEEQ